MEVGRRFRRIFDYLLYGGHVPVIDVRIGYDVNQLAGLEADTCANM